MSECTHDCSTCKADCSSRKESLIEQPHSMSKIKKVIGIVSGKGGVGKSLVTSLMAVYSQRNGFRTAVLDADITGPSIPKAFGITKKAEAIEEGILPVATSTGIEVMSVNLLLEDENQPVVWRGPVIAGVVKQFWQDVIWNDVDYMFVDMPPGTGDVPLTVFQSIPLDGIIVVTSPQDLVSMIVNKAVKMAEMMNVKILGIVENMSYVKCPCCDEEIKLYGESHIDEIAAEHGLKILAKLPIDPTLAKQVDNGAIELYNGNALDEAAKIILG
ncbi:MAG: Mrp/NBP35 family ATP-binding protein [Oscillospiraceae bacterium]|nr:Mrp/NBP35 family ATP-binding protein [Oscillospiraceae bacterium]MBQ8883356.1 Mrp/NBP35 family ATP-binding protein [Oscillospiraceae bacterium]